MNLLDMARKTGPKTSWIQIGTTCGEPALICHRCGGVLPWDVPELVEDAVRELVEFRNGHINCEEPFVPKLKGKKP